MRIPLSLICLLFIMLQSCQSKKVLIPEGIIPGDSMSMILTDLQLAESALSLSALDSMDKWRILYFEAVFSKHHTTQAVFDSSYRFYQEHPLLMGKILDQVIVLLSKMQTEQSWEEPPEEMLPEMDSVTMEQEIL